MQRGKQNSCKVDCLRLRSNITLTVNENQSDLPENFNMVASYQFLTTCTDPFFFVRQATTRVLFISTSPIISLRSTALYCSSSSKTRGHNALQPYYTPSYKFALLPIRLDGF